MSAPSTTAGPEPGGQAPAVAAVSRRLRALSVRNVGAAYVLVAIVVLFTVLRPDAFPTESTVKSILNQNAVLALAALALVIPLSAGLFDLSIGSVMSFASVMLAWLCVHQGVAIPLAFAVTFALAVAMGAVNAVIVVLVRIDSFIATLGTGALIQALVTLISNNQTVTDTAFNQRMGAIATTGVGGLQLAVFVALAVAVAIWLLLEHTVTGRRLYAIGFNREAAGLAGVRTSRLRFGSLVASAAIAGIAGMALTALVGTGSPDIGPPFLLDAFAAAFLGATQLRGGRFNAAGTIIAVLVLGTGTTGLTIVGAQGWVLSLFTGVVLIVALAIARVERAA